MNSTTEIKNVLYHEQLSSFVYDTFFSVFMISTISYLTIIFLYHFIDNSAPSINFRWEYLIIMVLLFSLVILSFINFRALRITITPTCFIAGYGMINTTVKLENITHYEEYTYEFFNFKGWALKYDIRNRIYAYSMSGDKNTGILIHYTNNKNQTVKLFVSSKNPVKIIEVLNNKLSHKID